MTKNESGREVLLDLLGLDPAIHDGGLESPRTVGQNGVEIYDFTPAVFVDGAWQPDDGGTRPRSGRLAGVGRRANHLSEHVPP